MKKVKKFILWGFVVLWMGNILAFSSQSAEISDRQSGYFVRIAQNLIVSIERRFDIKLINPNQLDYGVRKTAHVFNYFVLTILLIFAYLGINRSIKHGFIHTFQTTFMFSILDELFQTFIPGRSGMFRDVFIDQIGTTLALLLVFLVVRKSSTQ